MKKGLFLICIGMLFICSRCSVCDDCGDPSANVARYGMINKLDTTLTVIFYGESDSLIISLLPSDTSATWTRILFPPPGGSSGLDLFYTKNDNKLFFFKTSET